MYKNTVDLPEPQQLAHRYALSTKDMEEVIENLTCYQELAELHAADGKSRWVIACQALLTAAIVAYCRPFTDNKSLGYAKQKLGTRKLESIQIRRSLHELIMTQRNTFIAHADWSARSTMLTRSGENTLSASFTAPTAGEGVDVQEFLILAGGVRQECLRHLFEQTIPSALPEGKD